jgi:hypothetical protein
VINQVAGEKWLRHYDAIDLCDTGISVVDFASQHGVEFERVQEDGWGLCHYACVEIEQSLFVVFGMPESECTDPGVVFKAPGNAPSVKKCLEIVSTALSLDIAAMIWIQQDFDRPQWSLVRQGDDGNEVEITRFHKKEVAIHNMKRLESLGHKQYYNVKKM